MKFFRYLNLAVSLVLTSSQAFGNTVCSCDQDWPKTSMTLSVHDTETYETRSLITVTSGNRAKLAVKCINAMKHFKECTDGVSNKDLKYKCQCEPADYSGDSRLLISGVGKNHNQVESLGSFYVVEGFLGGPAGTEDNCMNAMLTQSACGE